MYLYIYIYDHKLLAIGRSLREACPVFGAAAWARSAAAQGSEAGTGSQEWWLVGLPE